MKIKKHSHAKTMIEIFIAVLFGYVWGWQGVVIALLFYIAYKAFNNK